MSPKPPVTPKPAATVVLVREGEEGREVFLTRRPETMSFLGGFVVFPGGRVDVVDHTDMVFERITGLEDIPPLPLSDYGDVPIDPRSFYPAAIRELFEEAGVLLLEDSGGNPVSPEVAERFRSLLPVSSKRFYELVAEHNLYLPAHRFEFVQLFVTPEFSPQRFYTVFLKTMLPEGQRAGIENREVTESFWISPDDALDEKSRGVFKMILPTVMALEAVGDGAAL
ncbi:MAG: NUDIX domain-containing protein [Deltaproteobacteria bacterium]|nr:NUDIX domain-containing protein [Candidatus Zymogenaceae bacterium]